MSSSPAAINIRQGDFEIVDFALAATARQWLDERQTSGNSLPVNACHLCQFFQGHDMLGHRLNSNDVEQKIAKPSSLLFTVLISRYFSAA
ncbi:MAG: hypothetical protein E7I42_28320 [Pluralibacter gergoviae]|nr:hypothetical protein [Pluralibacter gergoviae]